MANRSYLYRCDEIPDGKRAVRPQGLHEWNWDVPLVHKLMLAQLPRVVRSANWIEIDIAILAERNDAHLFAFYDLLAAGELPDRAELEAEVAAMTRFLRDRPSTYVLLEAGEIFQMSKTSPQSQVRSLCASITKLDARVKRALAGHDDAWLATLRASWATELRPGAWSEMVWLCLDGKPDPTKPIRAYRASERFEVGEQIEHPTFGSGSVIESGLDKITVSFGSGRRVLAQAKT